MPVAPAAAGGIAAGATIFGASISAGVLGRERLPQRRVQVRSGLLRLEGRQRQSRDREPVLLAFLVRNELLDDGGGAVTSPAAGTLLRPRMLAAAAPTTSKHVSAMIVMARVKPFSVSVDETRLLSPELGKN